MDKFILDLKQYSHEIKYLGDFDGGLCGILQKGLVQPPRGDKIKSSLTFLHDAGLISRYLDKRKFFQENKDELRFYDGELTISGLFVQRLLDKLQQSIPNMDIKLCKLICYGLRLGFAYECIIMAAALSYLNEVGQGSSKIDNYFERYKNLDKLLSMDSEPIRQVHVYFSHIYLQFFDEFIHCF